MTKTLDLARRSLSMGLAVLIFGLSVAVPLMDRGDLAVVTAVESSHQPGRCGHPHDHRICAQVGANVSVVSATYDYRLSHVTVRLSNPSEARSTVLVALPEGPPSRAPPLA